MINEVKKLSSIEKEQLGNVESKKNWHIQAWNLEYYPLPNKRTYQNKSTTPSSLKFLKNVTTQINVPRVKLKGFTEIHTSSLKAYLL